MQTKPIPCMPLELNPMYYPIVRYMSIKGNSEQSLANKCGLTQPAINKIKNGTYVPSVTVMARLFTALELTPVEINCVMRGYAILAKDGKYFIKRGV